MTSFAVPGQILGSLTSHLPGPNTHVFESNIVASKAGPITTSNNLVSISSPVSDLPTLNSRLLLRVLRVQRLSATCAILSILPTSTATIPTLVDDETQFQAVLRREDVRAYEKDKVVMNDSFRAGDLLKAYVISLGDERSYYVSTAGDEFGVVAARGEDGGWMSAVSWREMKDEQTGRVELRKVAKPV